MFPATGKREFAVSQHGPGQAFEHCQRPEAVWLVEVTAVLVLVMFGDQLVALPEELRGDAVDGFADTPPKRVIAIARALAVGFGDPD